MDTSTPVGPWLRQRRLSLDLTQEELARRVGCSADMIGKIETGARRPSRQIAALLAAALGLPAAEQTLFIRWCRRVPDLIANPIAAEITAGNGSGALAHESSAANLEINPYKGLHAFDEADAPFFFGREALAQRLCARLAEDSDLGRFLVVVGPSGSGKSSVVKAGLIPALRQAKLPSLIDPLVAEMAPGTHPFEELEAGLLRGGAQPTPGLMEVLREDERGLARAARHVLAHDGKSELLLVIDQFEELFTLTRDDAVRADFLDSLFSAVADPRARLRVVATLRADFYDRPLLYAPSGELMARRTEVVVPLTAGELYRAITRPAEQAGLVLEGDLAATIMRDVGEQPGTLSLLQYALTELYERREGRLLTLRAYAASGGVLAALARRAESLFAALSAVEQQEARQLFLRLVALGEGSEHTRRRVLMAELASAARDEAALHRVLDLYGRYRMLTFDRDPVAQAPTVEVAHEALLQNWERLRGWLNESREQLLVQRRLYTSALEWRASGQEASFLASGQRLAQFAGLIEEGTVAAEKRSGVAPAVALTAEERVFLSASLDQRQRQEAQERERVSRELVLQKRAASRLRVLLAGLAAFLIIAAGLTVWALDQSRIAGALFAHADALRLAGEANNLVMSHGDANLIALLSIRSLNAEYSPQADAALSEVAFQGIPPLLFEGHTSIVRMVKFSPDGLYMATGSDDNTVRLWDVATAKSIHVFSAHTATAGGVAFSPDGRYLVTTSDDRTARLWDLATGQTVRIFSGSRHPLGWPSFSPDGQHLLIDDGPTPHIWDVATAQMVLTFTGHTDAAFPAYSPDGKYVFTAGLDHTARLWDAATGEQIRLFEGQLGALSSAAYSPDGKYVAAGSEDHTIRIWDAATGNLVRQLPGIAADSGGVYGLAFSPDGKFLLSGGEGGIVQLFEIAGGMRVHPFLGHKGTIFWVEFSPDGKSLASASADNTARLWRLQTVPGALILSGHTNAVTQASFSPDGKRVATASWDNTARIWDATSGQELLRLAGHSASVVGVGFSPDGKTVLTASDDQTARLWDATSGKELRQFVGSSAMKQAAFSPDGKYVVIAAAADATVWEVETGKLILTFTGHAAAHPGRVAFAPNGAAVVTAASDGGVLLWEALSGKVLMSFKGHTAFVNSPAFSPDSLYLLTPSNDFTTRIWDVATGAELRRLETPGSQAQGASFSPDGTLIATAGSDGLARLWDRASGKELRQFTGHNNELRTVVFSPDGKYILTASLDNTARLWYSDYHDTIRYLCSLLTRDLTAEERTRYGIADQGPSCP